MVLQVIGILGGAALAALRAGAGLAPFDLGLARCAFRDSQVNLIPTMDTDLSDFMRRTDALTRRMTHDGKGNPQPIGAPPTPRSGPSGIEVEQGLFAPCWWGCA